MGSGLSENNFDIPAFYMPGSGTDNVIQYFYKQRRANLILETKW